MASLPVPPNEDRSDETYYQSFKRYSGKQYQDWKPWVEDQYLNWFGKDNKASYATRDTLAKTKIPGTESTPLNRVQDDTHDLVAGQVGKGGVLQPLGDAVSKEGVNRMERDGKDDKGEWLPGGAGKPIVDPVAGGVKSGVDGVKSGFGYFGGDKK